MTLKGWNIKYVPMGTLHWVAERNGIVIKANSKAELIQKISMRR